MCRMTPPDAATLSVSDDELWPRPCSRCGVLYDARLRGVEGRFHMYVAQAYQEAGHVVLVGHWREGVVPVDGQFVLKTATIEHPLRAEALPAASVASHERGQLRLQVLDGPEGAASLTGCLWGGV